jgi:hypothetical protein
MRRQIISFLQKRKFRLVTDWKRALKTNIESQLLIHVDFHFHLIFRCLDEVIFMLKHDDLEPDPSARPTFVEHLGSENPPTADHDLGAELEKCGKAVGRSDSSRKHPTYRAASTTHKDSKGGMCRSLAPARFNSIVIRVRYRGE